MTCEVSTLNHELCHAHHIRPVAKGTKEEAHVGDDAVEARACVAKSVLAGRELTEVPRSARHDIVVQLEDNAAERLRVRRNVKLSTFMSTLQDLNIMSVNVRKRWPCKVRFQ